MDNREEFEQWAPKNGLRTTWDEENGYYEDLDTEASFRAWQAASSESKILRQQADAIDECLAQWRETEEGKTYFTMSPGFLRDFAERLRREADEAEQ